MCGVPFQNLVPLVCDMCCWHISCWQEVVSCDLHMCINCVKVIAAHLRSFSNSGGGVGCRVPSFGQSSLPAGPDAI